MVHKKVALKNIKTLTFHADAQTASRRVSPIQQLTCVGRACDLFQPQVVQCSNMGDDGLGNVQWKCSTDLPSGLRLGKTDVSCEGWSKAGDANVLQGSCGLEYDLHRTDQNLMYEGHGMPKHNTIERYIDKAFSALFFVVTFILLYTIVRSVLLSVAPRFAPPPVSSFFPWGGGGGGGGGPGFGGGGGGHHHHHSHPPPPYTKIPEEARQTQPGATAAPTTTGPGFLGGLAGGVAAGYLASSLANRNTAGPSTYRGTTQRRFDDDDDRGVGPSNSGNSGLGEMRRATGFGSSSTR